MYQSQYSKTLSTSITVNKPNVTQLSTCLMNNKVLTWFLGGSKDANDKGAFG